MKLATVLGTLEVTIEAVVFAFGIIGAIYLIKRFVKFIKCEKEYIAFVENRHHEFVSGSVISRNEIKRSIFVKNLFENTIAFCVGEKEYRFTEFSVDQVYPLNSTVEVIYDADFPASARVRNGTDNRDYKVCAIKTICEIVLIIVVLWFCPVMINGIFVWIDWAIRFVYELSGGVPYNL
ncbi:MAG: hypothetical protein ACI4JS_02415 [Oscillospiraceae bacterium]